MQLFLYSFWLLLILSYDAIDLRLINKLYIYVYRKVMVRFPVRLLIPMSMQILNCV